MKSQFAIDLIPQAQKHLKSVGFFLQKYWLELALISAGGLGLWLGSQQLPLLTQSQQLQTSISALQDKLSKASLPDKERLGLEKDLLALQKDRITLENTIRTNQLSGVGGLLLVLTAYVGWRNYQATQQKQVAERFSKAVEQLGNDNIHVRLGGIYALEQIAKDAEEKYYWQVMETLTAYVREKSPYRPESEEKPRTLIKSILQSQTPLDPKESLPLATDIQAVMMVLARRKHSYQNGEEHPLDLRKTNLQDLHLPPQAKLKGINFCDTNLQQADLREANLQGAFLIGANLQQADLREANLQGAFLMGASLQQADFVETRLQQADLREASLQGAFLMGAKLQQAKLERANLQQADLRETSLQGAFLMEAKLQQAKLERAKLQQTNFRGADLQGADLRKASLQQTILERANLQHADLRKASLQEAFLYEAKLRHASFGEANLQEAKFRRDEFLQDAIGLTWEQLQKAESYEGAELPDYLLRNLPASSETQQTGETPQTEHSSDNGEDGLG